MKTMNLSEEEVKIISERRAEKHHEKATFAFQVKSIQIANEYFAWCKKEGFYTPNFGTFVNSFCYEGPDAEVMCEAVHQIWKLVFSLQIPKKENSSC